jgi:riboflavin synthase
MNQAARSPIYAGGESMFTGLVEGLGRVARLTNRSGDAVLCVEPPWPISQAVIGESVAVNGACLTVTGVAGKGFDLGVSAETLGRTTLGGLQIGDQVNLERAMQLGDRLGGHLVSGHVDCQGSIVALNQAGGSLHLEIAMPAEHLALTVEKGSVAVDGISLTVNQVDADRIHLNIIPHTTQATTLNLAKKGDSVNIETDLIGKYVARLLNRENDSSEPLQSLSLEDLKRMGY